MGYAIYKHRDSTVRHYDRWLYTLHGNGEHEGTNLTLPQEQIFMQKAADERELAALLDRMFLRAHHDRLSPLSATPLMGSGDE